MPFETLKEFSLQSDIKPLIKKDTATHTYVKVKFLLIWFVRNLVSN